MKQITFPVQRRAAQRTVRCNRLLASRSRFSRRLKGGRLEALVSKQNLKMS
jgi:hypothetical protein